MAEQIRAKERLARACAGLSTSVLQDLVNSLQAYHEQYYNELVNAGQDTIMRAQGKVSAIQEVTKTILESRQIVSSIDIRRAETQQRPDYSHLAM